MNIIGSNTRHHLSKKRLEEINEQFKESKRVARPPKLRNPWQRDNVIAKGLVRIRIEKAKRKSNRHYKSVKKNQMKTRFKQTAEIFTPKTLVDEILDKLDVTDPSLFTDPSKTYLDNSCGNGSFLIRVFDRKICGGSSFEQAMQTTFGVDIMVDNVLLV